MGEYTISIDGMDETQLAMWKHLVANDLVEEINAEQYYDNGYDAGVEAGREQGCEDCSNSGYEQGVADTEEKVDEARSRANKANQEGYEEGQSELFDAMREDVAHDQFQELIQYHNEKADGSLNLFHMTADQRAAYPDAQSWLLAPGKYEVSLHGFPVFDVEPGEYWLVPNA